MNALVENRKEIARVINRFVESSGYDSVMTSNEIKRILTDAGIELNTMILFSDMCYNRTNVANFDTFENDILCFIYEKRNAYRLVGQNYPYTGEVLWKQKGSSDEVVLGEWINGELVHFNGVNTRHNESKETIKKEFDDIEEIVNKDGVEGLFRESIVKVRVNQSEFRNRLLKRYKGCCICGVREEHLLVASHIKPWAVASPSERVDLYNGFLLCPNHDKLYDGGWITFDDQGGIIVSKQLSPIDRTLMGITDDIKVNVVDNNVPYLEYHRENIFRK